MSTLVEEALALALEALRGGGIVPFAIVNGPTVRVTSMITAHRSDTAMNLGRRFVRQHAAGCTDYVIVVDEYMRIGGERHDALMVESGTHGSTAAIVHAHLYAGAAWTRPPMPVMQRPSALIDPFDLRWGEAINPDLFDPDANLAIHAISHALESDAAVTRTIRFLRARIRYHDRGLPPGMRQVVAINDHHQAITAANRRRLRDAFPGVRVEFGTEGVG
jgi:hypothetical protein